MGTDPRRLMDSAPVILANHTEIREANEADNEGLLALTRATPMAGTIGLRIDRDPDFFALLRMRGHSIVYVALRGGEVIGCISAALRTSYIAGAPETAAYVGDMKVHPRFSGSRIAIRLIRRLETHLRSAGIDLCFSLVAEGNQRAMPLFEGRLGIPRWVSMGKFVVKELLPSPFEAHSDAYRIKAAEPKDLTAVTELMDHFHRSRQFGPRVMEEEIAQTLCLRGEHPFSRTFVARDDRHTVATLSVLDTAPVKRNILLSAPRSARVGVALLRLLAAPFPGFCVPKIGDPLRLLTVRYFACEDGHEEALRLLVRRARREAFRKRFTFLVFGLHESDPLRSLVRGMPGFTFSSLAFATSLIAPARMEALAQGIPFEDYALV
jgi:predicted N-acetyltransferase YhbS